LAFTRLRTFTVLLSATAASSLRCRART
jgi:hypothetical protein